MLKIIFWIILGLIGLLYGGKFVIIGLENIAKQLNISQLMLGLTVLAFGTSLPEIAVSIMGGIDKLIGIAPTIDGIVIGNKVGSFLTQITLILGILGLSQNIVITKWELRREGTMLFLSIFIFIIFALDLVFTYFEGFLFMLFYLLYLIFVIWSEKQLILKKIGIVISKKETVNPKFFKTADSTTNTPSIKSSIGIFLLGLLILIVAADITILATSSLAKELNIPTNVVGILIVGIGTSLPELTADLTAIRRGSSGIAVGDILGSNICDILFATGSGVIIAEFNIPMIILVFDIPIIIIALFFVLTFFWTEKTLKKWEAAFLVVFYGFYVLLKIFYFQSATS